MIYLKMPNGAEYDIELGKMPEFPDDDYLPTTEDIAHKVANYFNIPTERLKQQTRAREVVQARQIAMYLAKTFTLESLKAIGQFFGGRDHTTVIHSCQTVRDLMFSDHEYRKQVLRLKNLIN